MLRPFSRARARSEHPADPRIVERSCGSRSGRGSRELSSGPPASSRSTRLAAVLGQAVRRGTAGRAGSGHDEVVPALPPSDLPPSLFGPTEPAAGASTLESAFPSVCSSPPPGFPPSIQCLRPRRGRHFAACARPRAAASPAHACHLRRARAGVPPDRARLAAARARLSRATSSGRRPSGWSTSCCSRRCCS